MIVVTNVMAQPKIPECARQLVEMLKAMDDVAYTDRAFKLAVKRLGRVAGDIQKMRIKVVYHDFSESLMLMNADSEDCFAFARATKIKRIGVENVHGETVVLELNVEPDLYKTASRFELGIVDPYEKKEVRHE